VDNTIEEDIKLVAQADAVIFGDAFVAGKFDFCRQFLKDNELLDVDVKKQLFDCIDQMEAANA